MVQPHTTSKSILAVDNMHVSCLWVTANNQLTIHPKDGKCLLWDSDPSPSCLARLMLLPVLPLGSCPKG